MKKFLYLFSVIAVIIFRITAITAEAKTSSNNYKIVFEKLAGTETADEFEEYKEDLIDIITKDLTPAERKQIDTEKIDFNNENIVKGYKKYYGMGILQGIQGLDEIRRSAEIGKKITGIVPGNFLYDDTYSRNILITVNNIAVYTDIILQSMIQNEGIISAYPINALREFIG